MTAEVAILNKGAVALAADSAATLSNQKIFNSAHKIFALSKYEPVGLMVYNDAEIMGVPIETVVKEFRREQGSTYQDHLDDYLSGFLTFLEESSLFSDELRQEQLRQLTTSSFNLLEEFVKHEFFSDHRNLTQKNLKQITMNAVDLFSKSIESCESLPSIGSKKRQIFGDVIREVSLQHRSSILSWGVSKRCADKFTKYCLDRLLKIDYSLPHTGIVITGFGRKDVFPKLRSVMFSHSYLGVTLSKRIEAYDVSPTSPAKVMPFAQQDGVELFLDGCSGELVERLDYEIEQRFLDLTLDAEIKSGKMTSEQAASIKASPPPIIELMRQFVKISFTDISQINRQSSLDIIGFMAKSELAQLAESLVNVTALKRRASSNAETVGGPIDVAVISKGDGLVWIKRKHYFDVEQNPGFKLQYLEERADEK